MAVTEWLAALTAASLISGFAGWVAGGRQLLRRSSPVAWSGQEETKPGTNVLEEVLTFLPEPALLLAGNGSLRFAGQEAVALFGDTLGTIIRHPDVFMALRRLSPETPRVTADIVLDVPVRRMIRLMLCLLPENLATPETQILALLTDRSEQDAVRRVRSDFVAYASHELRTPLAALIGFIETLRGPAADDPAAQKQFLEIMATQAARMQRLIEQLLTLSRVEMSEHRRPRGEADAGRIVARVRDESAPLCAARGVVLQTTPMFCVFPGDEDQIVQVLLNLIENAMKYATAADRKPEISLTVSEREADGKSGIAFAVCDNGPGIEARHLPRLTERFYRVENGSNATGYGLGLAIVRHITDRHEGRFIVESEVGKGTCCTVWFPREEPRRQPRTRPAPASAR